MSTTTAFDATAVAPRVRPALPSLEPKTTESLHHDLVTITKIFAACAAASMAGVVVFSTDIDSPRANDHGCSYFTSLTSPQNYRVSHLAIERNENSHGLPTLREPTGTDWVATGNCVGPYPQTASQ
jgi:hypothetical protein